MSTVTNTTRPSQGFTEVQIDSIQGLLRRNILFPVVVSVMENMLSVEGPPAVGDDVSRAEVVAHSEPDPPDYDFK